MRRRGSGAGRINLRGAISKKKSVFIPPARVGNCGALARSTHARMEASADWPSLQKRGFVVIKQFLSADQCAELAKCYETLPAATDSIGFGVRWAIEACCTAFCLATPHEPAYPLQLGAGLLWATVREFGR